MRAIYWKDQYNAGKYGGKYPSGDMELSWPHANQWACQLGYFRLIITAPT